MSLLQEVQGQGPQREAAPTSAGTGHRAELITAVSPPSQQTHKVGVDAHKPGSEPLCPHVSSLRWSRHPSSFHFSTPRSKALWFPHQGNPSSPRAPVRPAATLTAREAASTQVGCGPSTQNPYSPSDSPPPPPPRPPPESDLRLTQ